MKKKRKQLSLRKIPQEVCQTRVFDVILLRNYNAVYNQNTIIGWMKGCIFLFPKNFYLRIAKNYRGINLSLIAAMIYNVLLLNCLELKTEKILRKNQNGFQGNRSTTSQILTIRRILGVHAKISGEHFYSSTSPMRLTSYTERRWNKYF